MRFIRDGFKRTSFDQGVVGLDIGRSAIKCVVLVGSGSSYRLKHSCVWPLPSQCGEEEPEGPRMAAHIKQLLAATDISARSCVVALPDSVVASWWFPLDPAVTGQVDVAVHLAVEERILCPLGEVCFDYQVFHSSPGSRAPLNILVAVCKRKYVDVRLEMIQRAGLAPLAIEINSYAVKRAYTQLYPEELIKISLLLDVGVTHLTLLFWGATEQVCSYSESVVGVLGRKATLQRVQQCFNTFCLAYPYYKFRSIFLIGSVYPLLEFLARKLNGVYRSKVEILAWGSLLPCANDAAEKMLLLSSPALLLSFGLALRGLQTND